MTGSWNQDAHQRALMVDRRCSSCAERVGPSVLLRDDPCPYCGRKLIWPSDADAETVIEAIERKWKRHRYWIYGAVTLSAGLTGFLPIIPTLITVGFMIYLRYALMRAPLAWFSPGRRFTSRFALKLWMVLVGCVTLGLNELFNLLPFVNIILKAAMGLASTALFVEVSLWYLRGRLRRESEEGPALEGWEWGLPAGLIGVTLAVGGASLVAVVVTFELIANLFQ